MSTLVAEEEQANPVGDRRLVSWLAVADVALVAIAVAARHRIGMGESLGLLVVLAPLLHAVVAGWCLGIRPASAATTRHLVVLPALAQLAALAIQLTPRELPWVSPLLLPLGSAYGLGWATGWAGRQPAKLATPAMALGLAVAGILTVSLHLYVSLVCVVVFPLVALLASHSCQQRQTWLGTRLVLAATLGFAATWGGVAWNVEHFDNRESHTNARAYEQWLAAHGASTDTFQTRMVSGFPLQQVEGNGFGGAQERLPMQKGMGALLLNLLLLFAASAGIAFLLPSRWLGSTQWLIAIAATCAGCSGCCQLLRILD